MLDSVEAQMEYSEYSDEELQDEYSSVIDEITRLSFKKDAIEAELDYLNSPNADIHINEQAFRREFQRIWEEHLRGNGRRNL